MEYSSWSERASGNRLQENLPNFASRPKSSQRIKICEPTSFWHPVGAGISYKTIPDVDDGFGDFTPVCREHTLPRADPRSRVFGEILGGTVIGPVVAFLVVQIPGTFGIEIEIPSPNRPELVSYVLICRRKNRFVNELHIPDPEHNLASSELLTEQLLAEEDEPWFTEMKQSCTEETRAKRVRNIPDPVCHKKSIIPAKERKWKKYSCLSIVPRNNALNKLVMIFVRNCDQDERDTDENSTLEFDKSKN